MYQQYAYFIDTCVIFWHESSFNDGPVYLNQEIASFSVLLLLAAAAVHNGTSPTF